MRANLRAEAHATGADPSQFVAQLAAAIGERVWEGLTDEDGRPLTCRRFLEAPPPTGLGLAAATVRDLATLPQRRAALPEHAVAARAVVAELDRLLLEPLGPRGGARVRGRRADGVPKGGNSRDYALRRLARDAPDLAEAVLRGELSANAAAIQAGIRPKPSALAAARAAWRRLDAAEQQSFINEVLASEDPTTYTSRLSEFTERNPRNPRIAD